MFGFFIQQSVLSIHSDVAVYGIKTEALKHFLEIKPILLFAPVLILASTRLTPFNYQFTILSVVEVL